MLHNAFKPMQCIYEKAYKQFGKMKMSEISKEIYFGSHAFEGTHWCLFWTKNKVHVYAAQIFKRVLIPSRKPQQAVVASNETGNDNT